MPRYDGSGPLGEGPKSGRGMGRCGTDYDNNSSRGYGLGRGQGGLGRGRGQSRYMAGNSINKQNELLEKISGKLEKIVEKLDLKV